MNIDSYNPVEYRMFYVYIMMIILFGYTNMK